MQRARAPLAVTGVTAVVTCGLLAVALARGWLGPDVGRGSAFCEAARDGLVRQPANTFSNLGFVIAGLLIAVHASRPGNVGTTLAGRRHLPALMACVVVFLGPASAAMHASQTALGGRLDMLSMFLIAALAAAYALTRWVRGGTVTFVVAFAAGVVLCEIVESHGGHVPVVQTAGNTVFGALLVFASLVELLLMRRRETTARHGYAFASIGTLILAFTIWNATNYWGMCAPHSLLQGHAVWHLLDAVAAYLLYRYYASERDRPVEPRDGVNLVVTGADGVRLAVYIEGDPTGPAVLLVHGYPDTHRVWDPLVAQLVPDHRVVRYDVRGAGHSAAPPGLRPYRLAALADDLFAVIDATSPGRAVHVVAHDWGSLQAWEAVTDPRAVGRIARFTSISGPALDHVGLWIRSRARSSDREDRRQARRQGLASWYVYALHLPFGGPLVWSGLTRRWRQLRADGSPPSAAKAMRGDAMRGVKLYRANVLPRLLRPRERRTELPVQLIVLTRDPFVRPALLADTARWAPDLRRDTIDAGHWSALALQADTVAGLLSDFAVRGVGQDFSERAS